jgi:UDP:flavonoid glycosyltransferase YjiC (YdhE family)
LKFIRFFEANKSNFPPFSLGWNKLMKFLLVPSNNSESHIFKCLAIREILRLHSHLVLIAVAQKHAPLLERLGVEHCLIPDIQESDDSPLPTVEWFRNPGRILQCIKLEMSLLRKFKPDRVLGVFRFTTRVSTRLLSIPFDSLVCGCMLPFSTEVLGFAEGEPGRELQRAVLDSFFRYAAARMNMILTGLGHTEIKDIRALLVGDRTFLWDLPEFMPLPSMDSCIHVGPVCGAYGHEPEPDFRAGGCGDLPLAILTFGITISNRAVAEKLIRVLLDLGHRVLLAAGGQKELGSLPETPNLTIRSFVPLPQALPQATVMVCHGGQMTVFDGLKHGVPILVVPFQPEQAHNGLCLERIGCGRRLLPTRLFWGNPQTYIDAVNEFPEQELSETITKFLKRPELPQCLRLAQMTMEKYNGAERLAAYLEGG